MLPFTQWFDQDLQDAVKVHHCESVVFSGDADSVQIGVRLTNGGTAVSLSGETCIGYVIRGDFATVGPINCTVSNNAVSMLLNQSALACDGVIGVSIKVGTITVLKAIFGTEPTTTDTLVDPGHVIPSIEELLAQIDKMESAISRGNAAAELCEGMTVSASAVAGNTPTVTKTTNYNAVTPAADANPKELGYYEYDDGAYVLTEDTTVQGGKTYYVGTFGLTFGLVPASISSQVPKYQVSSSGTTIPTGTWQDTVPAVPQGDFLWTQYTITWLNAQTSVLYSVARQGIDGSGAVSTVNGISPDANGEVTLPTDNTPTENSTNYVKSGGVYSAIEAHFPVSVAEGGTGGTTAAAARSGIGVALKPICVDFGTVSALPTTVNAEGITADMIPIAWELDKEVFDTDLTVTTAADSVTISGTIHTGSSSTVKITFSEVTPVSGT